MKRLSRAYAVSVKVMECMGCESGLIRVVLNDDTYRVSCPLLTAECKYGLELHQKLEAHARTGVLAIPGLPAIFRDHFAEPQFTTAVQEATLWAQKAQTFLLFHGEHGTGKSFAAAYALYVLFRKRLLEHWQYPTMWGAPNAMWLGAYRAATRDDLFEMAKVVSLLVLDDLGSEENTQRAQRRIAEIISERYNQRRATILTANVADALDLAELYTQRMVDRVLGAGDAVYCGGESLRLVG